MKTEYYKIRNKDGLYSTGGASPTFKSLGKIWTLPQLKTHLKLIAAYKRSLQIYENCELVLFTPSYVPASITLRDIVDPLEKDLIIKKLKGNV